MDKKCLDRKFPTQKPVRQKFAHTKKSVNQETWEQKNKRTKICDTNICKDEKYMDGKIQRQKKTYWRGVESDEKCITEKLSDEKSWQQSAYRKMSDKVHNAKTVIESPFCFFFLFSALIFYFLSFSGFQDKSSCHFLVPHFFISHLMGGGAGRLSLPAAMLKAKARPGEQPYQDGG